ncbi:hypothetical protein IKA15_00315 [bacterium]|nr:hypothetical protein [bacterium]
MKRFFATFLICSLALPAFAFEGEITLDENVQKPEIIYSEKPRKITGSLFINNAEDAQMVINKQQESDVKDLEKLWAATAEKNQIIKFSLQKLAIPEEQRRIHSSLMAKSLSALISGASMLPSFMGSNYAIQSASYAGARLANNLINRENYNKLKDSPLTDTEMLELATLIEELQDNIVNSYYGYKGSLLRLKEIRSQMLLYNKNYNTALNMNDTLEIAVASALWDSVKIKEAAEIENVKKYQALLERYAGQKTVKELELVQYNLDMTGVDVKDLKTKVKNINEVQK